MVKQPKLGPAILKRRKEKEFTQEELAELNVRTIHRLERGKVIPQPLHFESYQKYWTTISLFMQMKRT